MKLEHVMFGILSFLLGLFVTYVYLNPKVVQYQAQVKGLEVQLQACPIAPLQASTSPIATSFTTNTSNVPNKELNSLKSQVSELLTQATSLQKTITSLQLSITTKDVDLAKSQTVINTQAGTITSLYAQISALQQLHNVVQTTPKTKDQLTAQYQVAHPYPVCKALPNDDSRTTEMNCNNDITNYYTALNAWVNAQLAAQ